MAIISSRTNFLWLVLFTPTRSFSGLCFGFIIVHIILHLFVVFEEIGMSCSIGIGFLFLKLIICNDVLLRAKPVAREFGWPNRVHINLLLSEHYFFTVILFIALVVLTWFVQFTEIRFTILWCRQIKKTLIPVLQISTSVFAWTFTRPRLLGFEVFYNLDLLLHAIIVWTVLGSECLW